MNRAAWIFGLVSITIGTSARSARALGPVDVEIGAKVGGATNPYSATGALNPLGLGIGARAGVVLLDHLYGGVDVMYYLGGSGPALGGPPGPPVTLTDHTWKYGVEAGWGFKLIDVLTIRPQVGLGNVAIGVSGNVPGLRYASTSSLYVGARGHRAAFVRHVVRRRRRERARAAPARRKQRGVHGRRSGGSEVLGAPCCRRDPRQRGSAAARRTEERARVEEID